MAKPMDVLWLVEHTARESDAAGTVLALGAQRYGLTGAVRGLYQHIPSYLEEFDPKVVVHPFVYFVKGALATEDVFARWPDAVHFNMAWEQIHYQAHLKIKAPSDETARKKTIHHAWGPFYTRYLLEHGVPAENIFENGHPAYQLYQEPYRRYFPDRNALAARHGLDASKKWLFVPENYRWAFAEGKLGFFTSLGGDQADMERLVAYSKDALADLFRQLSALSSRADLEIIFRPRPAVSMAEMKAFARGALGDVPGGPRFIKEGSVREWILASDAVLSSYSTSLVEAAVAGKPGAMFEPQPLPAGLHAAWYDHAPRVKSAADIAAFCEAGHPSGPLSAWAHQNLLALGDPLERLAWKLHGLARTAAAARPGPLPAASKDYFNAASHEMDAFDAAQAEDKVAAWSRALAPLPHLDESPGLAVNKSMDRDDLLSADAVRLTEDLKALLARMQARGVAPSSWVGTIRKPAAILADNEDWTASVERDAIERGIDQRLEYEPLPGAYDDPRFPWFLLWEIWWVNRFMSPRLKPGQRLLDAGGVSSLFSCYMASRGFETHSVDLNEKLLENGRRAAEAMGWDKARSYVMDMRKLDFPDGYFDHGFSICVFEHLDYDVKRAALEEMARCVKPGGVLSLTFDYRNPAPGVAGVGKDPRPRNALKTEADIHRSFLGTGRWRLMGNPVFADNGKSYLRHPLFGRTPYTFGAVFLERLANPRPAAAAASGLRTARPAGRPLVSLVVCTYNRDRLLAECLDSLLEQANGLDGAVEIIVVDNGGFPAAERIVCERRARCPYLSMVREAKVGLSHARNRGAEAARGDYVGYLDDDARVPTHYVAAAVEVAENHRPDILGGPVYPQYEGAKPWWFHDDLEIRKFAAASGFQDVRVSGGNFFIRRDLLRELGMFRPDLGMQGDAVRLGEERELLIRYQRSRPPEARRIYYSLDVSIYHWTPREKMRLSYVLRRGIAAGRSLIRTKGPKRRHLFEEPLDFLRIWLVSLPWALLRGRRSPEPAVMTFRRGAVSAGKVFQTNIYFLDRLLRRGEARQAAAPDAQSPRTAETAAEGRPRVLHIVPESAGDPAMRFHGSSKDILSHSQYFEDRGFDVDRLVVARGDGRLAAALEQKDLSLYGHVLVDIPKAYPLTARYLKSAYPALNVVSRSENAELHHRLDWARAARKLGQKWHFVRGAYCGWGGDRACSRAADWILPISDYDARYWQGLRGTARVATVPYFIPRDLRPAEDPRVPKTRLCLGLGAIQANPLIDDAHRRFAAAVKKLGARAPEWRFAITGQAPAGLQLPSRVLALGILEDPHTALRESRAMAILSNYGRGFKTKIMDALVAKAFVLVTPALLARLPGELAEGCLPVRPGSVEDLVAALERAEGPFPAVDFNGLLQERAYAAMDRVFGPAGEAPPPQEAGLRETPAVFSRPPSPRRNPVSRLLT